MPKQGDFAARIAEAKALADHCEPHTPESLAEFNSLRAAEMARAEAKRQQPHPQTSLPLGVA